MDLRIDGRGCLAKSAGITIIGRQLSRIDGQHNSFRTWCGLMARNEQLIRQHKILQILERVRFGRTIEELVQDCVDELGLTSLHPRTIRRDLEALQAAGIDVAAHEEKRGKVWKLGPRHRGDHRITATASELIALSLGRELLHPLAGTPFWMGIESFWNKIREELPASVWEYYDKYSASLRVSGLTDKSYERQHGVIKTINRGILERRVVEVLYESRAKPQTLRQLEPYALVLFQSSLYLIAADHEPDGKPSAAKTFKIDRMEKAAILDVWFKVPEDLNLDEFIGNSIGVFFGTETRDFKIRLKPEAARLLMEDPWHPNQQLSKLDDGNYLLELRAVGDVEVVQRVLSMGSEAEILEPPSARKTMTRIAENLAQMYCHQE